MAIQLFKEGHADSYLDNICVMMRIPVGNEKKPRSESERIQAFQNFDRYFNASFESELSQIHGGYRAKKELIQAMIVESDLPEAVLKRTMRFEERDVTDAGWLEAYMDASSYLDRQQWEIEVDDLNGGPIWEWRGEGEPVKGGTYSGKLYYAGIGKMGALLEWTIEMIKWRKIGPMLQRADKFLYKYEKKRADYHYGLMTSAANDAANITPYQSTGSDETINDCDTLDKAVYTILERLKNKGVPWGSQILAYVQINEDAMRRIRNMQLKQENPYVAGGAKKSMYIGQVKFIPSWNEFLPDKATDSFKMLLCLPKRMIQRAEEPGIDWLGPEHDITRYTFAKSAWKWLGAAVADADDLQIARFT